MHSLPSFPSSLRLGAAVSESGIRRSGSTGEGKQPGSGLKMLNEDVDLCFHPCTLTRGCRRVRDARWPHARACSVHRGANVPNLPPSVWLTCHPHRHLPPDGQRTLQQMEAIRPPPRGDAGERGRLCARHCGRIQSSVSHLSFASDCATSRRWGGGSDRKFKTILAWKLKQKSWPTFLCQQEIGCVLFMRSGKSVVMNLGHWKEDVSKARRSGVPRLFTLPPPQHHLRPPLVTVSRAIAKQSRSIMLTSQSWGEVAAAAVTKLCSTFLIPCTSALGEGSPSLPLTANDFHFIPTFHCQTFSTFVALACHCLHRLSASTQGFSSLPASALLLSS